MPHSKASRQVWVTVDGRRFRVNYDASDDAFSIVERRYVDKPPVEGGGYYCTNGYWHRDHHALGKMPFRILLEARRLAR